MMIRQLANFSSVFLIIMFSNMLKAALVSPGQPIFLQFNHEISNAGKPIILYYQDKLEYNMLSESKSKLDEWLYANAHVFFFNE